MTKISAGEWYEVIATTLAQQPELAATTVQAMQAGLIEALDRQQERNADLSMGLWQAMTTKPHHVKRDHAAIVRAIEASTLYGSAWAKQAIEKELSFGRPDLGTSGGVPVTEEMIERAAAEAEAGYTPDQLTARSLDEVAQYYDTHDAVTGELLENPAHQERGN